MTKTEKLKMERLEANLNTLLTVMQNRLDEAEKSYKDAEKLGDVALEWLKTSLLGKTIEIKYASIYGGAVQKTTGTLENVAYNTHELRLDVLKILDRLSGEKSIEISKIKSIKIVEG